ncbi:hypothetical protein BAQ46_11465 [Bacillus paranthracis]|uniref:hypothetical protein n=1 Tax=Bacillus paranthracis TaxID=2026186 RepID=UPI0008FE71B7|nr:hypothetical protein [Bacillus paranthracis]OJE27609.1 hypothetical protein BAQ46_11465 [Bacillus paranthracis]
MNNMNIMNNLYQGLGYEQQAMGQFWKMGYEAFKFNADFGFDILVHNLQRCFAKVDSSKENYYFQVKSRQCKADGFGFKQTNDGLVRVLYAQLDFKKEYLQKILQEDNSFLLCYLYDPTKPKLDSIITSFWLNSKNLKWIFEQKKYFDEYNEKYYLTLQVLYNANLKHLTEIIKHQAVEKLGLEESAEIRNSISTLNTKAHIINHQFTPVVNVLPNNENKDNVNMYILNEEFFDLTLFKQASYSDFNENPFTVKKYVEFEADSELIDQLRDYAMTDISYEVSNIYL